MKKIYTYDYVADAYKDLLLNIQNSPEFILSPREQKCKEITNVIITIKNPNFNLFENQVRSSKEKYICAELLWYFSGSNTVEFISQYAKTWNELKNTNNTVNSAYGYLLFKDKNIHGFSQYEWAFKSLVKDKDTRQAFMHFNNSSHQFFENKDQVCTLNGLFQIRNNKLNFTITMRSNDAILGFMTDFAFFNVLHQQMYRHLQKFYTDLEMGTYTHITNSMHIYERHFKLVDEMLKFNFNKKALPVLDCNLINEKGERIEENGNFVTFIKKCLIS